VPLPHQQRQKIDHQQADSQRVSDESGRSAFFWRSAQISPAGWHGPELPQGQLRNPKKEMSDNPHDYEVQGEIIKMIHAELPALRWACGGCGEDSCTIFYQPSAENELVECETCGASNLVRKA
jgi:hypothetical protein